MKKCKIPATLIQLLYNQRIPAYLIAYVLAWPVVLNYFGIPEDHSETGRTTLGLMLSVAIPIILLIVVAFSATVYSSIRNNSMRSYYTTIKKVFSLRTILVTAYITSAFVCGTAICYDDPHPSSGGITVVILAMVIGVLVFAIYQTFKALLRYIIKEYQKACDEVS